METPPPDSTPAAPPPPESSGSGSQWSAPPPPAQPVASASGFVYADVPNRAIAYIIDAIILLVINIIVVGIVIGSFLPTTSINPNPTGLGDLVTVNYAGVLVSAVVNTLINGAYFIYTWTTMRGSVGQKLLGMQVGNFPDGATLKQDQAIRRWIFLGAPLGLLPALVPIPALGLILVLAGLAYFIYLLVTTAQSPTKQGFHDKQANTVVVKAARSVA
jgi:uncharacterized RDD family membrane protein YckC